MEKETDLFNFPLFNLCTTFLPGNFFTSLSHRFSLFYPTFYQLLFLLFVRLSDFFTFPLFLPGGVLRTSTLKNRMNMPFLGVFHQTNRLYYYC